MSDTAAPRGNRKLLIALAAIVALALLFVVVVRPLLFGGDDLATAPEVQAAGGGVDVAQAEPTEEPTAEPEAEPVPETFEVFNARDPFDQLVEPETGGGGTVTAADGSTPQPVDASGNPAPTPTPSPTPTTLPSEQPNTAPSEAPPDAQVGATTVRLVDVFTDDGVDKTLVTVNDTGYTVKEGETFATRFKLLDISDSCATYLFGDSRFTLCEGQEIRK